MSEPPILARTTPDDPRPVSGDGAAEPFAGIEPVPVLGRGTVTSGGPAGRYQVGERRGAGATGAVYLAHDADLGRTVAVKVLNAGSGAERFAREARIAGALEHPNIVPVYDLDRTADGRLCFTMRLVEGRSLGEAIREPAGLGGAVERIHIVRKVCDALAYAHHQGILHQDVKPDNILLGRFGEVLLVDWGAASSLAEARIGGKVVGTPAYLAPEVARGEAATIASDVYALGATMFHLLTGRYPLWADDEEGFWRRKRAGELDAPTAAERRVVPAALLAIAMRCLAGDAGQRYRSVREVAQELDRFQSGLAVAAYRDPLAVRLARWHRRHARALWSTALVAASILIAGVVVYGERLKEIATWGLPLASEHFADGEGWQERWRVVNGAFAVRDGALVSGSDDASTVYLTRRMEGDTAIEYDGTMLPDQPPCDISVAYALEDPFTAVGSTRTYLLQVGANDNSYAQIFHPDNSRVASNPLMLQPGRSYHVRMEIEGDTLRILVDGRLICEYRDMLPIQSGWIGLYAFYKGKAFDNLRVYSKGMPQRVSVLAVGDQYCLDGAWDRAAAFYGRVAAVHAGKAIGEEAVFRQGFALRRGGHGEAATAAWAPIAAGRWGGRIGLLGLEDRLAAGDHAGVARAIAAAYPAGDEDLRARLVALWIATVRRAARPYGTDTEGLRALLAVRERWFPALAGEVVAHGLYALGEFDTLLATCTDQVAPVADTLIRLGRPQEILTRFPERRYQVGQALAQMGRLADLQAMRPPMPWMQRLTEADLHCDLGDFDPAAALIGLAQPTTPWNWEVKARDAVRIDRPELAVALYHEMRPGPSSEVLAAFLLAGADDDLLATYPLWGPGRAEVAYHRAVQGFLAGEPVRVVEADPGPAFYDVRQLGFSHLVLAPFIAGLAGDRAAADAGFARLAKEHRWQFYQVPWHCGEYLAGRMDAATFLRQPSSGNAPPLLLLCQGMRAELVGDRTAARAAYGAFLVLAPHLRCLHLRSRDPVAEVFAQWRFRALAPP